MIYALSSYRYTSLAVTSCISHMDAQTGRSTVVLIRLTFMLRPHIYIFSLHACGLDNQCAVSSSGPGLYSLHILYCCMHRIMCCKHCESVATSVFIITTNGLWYLMTCT